MDPEEYADLHAFDCDFCGPYNDATATAWATVQHIWEEAV